MLETCIEQLSMMKMMKLSTSNSSEMPIIGLGTFKLRGKELVLETIETALAAGYRSIDTAAVYRNESEIGESLKVLLPKYSLKREDVFITSKLGPKDQGAEKCKQACLNSIKNLQTGYLDLYLIHWPGTQGMKQDDQSNIKTRRESWRDLEELYREGKVRAIGVSNYEQRHLIELLSYCSIPPSILQIEHHPHLVQRSLVSFCRQHNIHFQAYSSLGTTSQDNKLLQDPTVISIARNCRKTAAQILLRWAVQQDIGVVPKSTNPVHIQENMDIFSFCLTDSDMDKLNNLDSQHHYCWNPAAVT